MAEMILPGTYIEVRAEGLTVPRSVSVGNIGIVGTAAKGAMDTPILLSSLNDAKQVFGDYDAWINGTSSELSLVRALELAYQQGATTVFAVRIGAGATTASHALNSTSGANVSLAAKSPGTWANDLEIQVVDADDDAFIEQEEPPTAAPSLSLLPKKSARNRVTLLVDATGITHSLAIIYDGEGAPSPGQVLMDRTNGNLTFGSGAPALADTITASYLVDKAQAVKVTLRLGNAEEVYQVASGRDLTADVNRNSLWVKATDQAFAAELPDKSTPAGSFVFFQGGGNGAVVADSHYKAGLDKLLTEPAHLILAAGRAESFADELAAHCKTASSDAHQRERIALMGSGPGMAFDDIRGHQGDSNRLIYVAPGFKTIDSAARPPKEITLPGAYAAAGVAGLLSSMAAHVSLTNKAVPLGEVEPKYNRAQLEQLVQARVLVLEQRRGVKVVRGITTATDTAWQQITTRRIVDFAKFGVRSASDPFIGKLNNERVRQALKSSIDGFLGDMIDREMLTAYELDVSATRAQEIRGIVSVTMVLQPTFSIEFIRVVMVLQ